MTQFCALLLSYYALLTPQRGGGMTQCPPPKYAPASGVRTIFQWGGFKSDIKNLVAIYTLANK